MSKKINFRRRLIASLLMITILFNTMPISLIKVFASTPEHPDAITLVVKDASNNNVSGATVIITIDGNEQPAITTDENGCIEIMSSDEFISEKDFSANISKEGYKSQNFTGTITEANQNFETQLVEKATQNFAFSNSEYVDNGTTSDTINYNSSTKSFEQKIYNFQAIDVDNIGIGSIQYQIDNNEIASIDSNGSLTVNYPGKVIVTATLSGNDDYKESTIKHTLQIGFAGDVQDNELVSFEKTSVNYILGENGGTISNRASRTLSTDTGEITYSIDNSNTYGLNIDSNGNITFDMEKTINALENNSGSFTTNVKATKASVTDNGIILYPENIATYVLTVSFLETPSGVKYKIEQTTNTDGWYKSEITVSASDGYLISKDGLNFSPSVIYGDNGINNFDYYLKETSSGKITGKSNIENVKIDTVAPSDVNIKYSNAIQEDDEFKFFNPSVTIEFSAIEENSGIDHFSWSYNREDGASISNLETDNGVIYATQDDSNPNKYIGTLTLPISGAELRGKISVSVVDKAGNVTNYDGRTEKTVVVDTIKPKLDVSYSEGYNAVDGKKYYRDDVTVTLTVTEANFFEEDVDVKVSKDGIISSVSPVWVDNTAQNIDEHIGTFKLESDGDYIIYVNYKDRSNNEMNSYVSDIIVVDKTSTVLEFNFNQSNQTTTFKVTEHNFRAQDITATVVAKDINGNSIVANDLTELLHSSEWEQNGDVYTLTTDEYVNGIYNINISYTDISLNSATIDTEEFIIDKDKPIDVQIDYSTSILDSLIGNIFYKFYNPNVTITFTAYDNISGVKEFLWNYTKQEGASSKNRPTDSTDTTIVAVQDSTDKSKFTATLTLPASEVEQLRGYLNVTAIDNYDNESNKYSDDGKVIVVDTISPELSVEYTAENRKVDSKYYYKDDCTVNFIVTEANFFEDDIMIKVSKNGENAKSIIPSWSHTSADNHIGTYILSGDGDYVITVQYKDRSNNVMTSYTSDVITIDTIDPIIKVSYSNSNEKNTLIDNESHSRKYYDNTQTATVTIIEHNFNPDEVDFSKIVSKDVAGNILGNNSISYSSWENDGDKHTIVITFKGDANYTFDVDYTDLSTRKALDYKTDYFTVDKTSPTNLVVTYSTSILNTILENTIFDFYNDRMIVTITASDDVSPITEFIYSYKKKLGVSSVNQELLKQAINNANIKYSNGGKTSTATFSISKAVLESTNQFNGNVNFLALDSASNYSEKEDGRIIVVDNIAPTISVNYNNAVNEENEISYYDGDINATVTINEANFYSEDVNIVVTKDGNIVDVNTVWTDESVDVHIGKFTLTEEGDYNITISYADKSNNQMPTYTSNQLTIDTHIDAPVITINGVNETGKAYKDDVKIAVNFEDINYSDYTIELLRTAFGNKNVNVNDIFIKDLITINDNKGGYGEFDTFERKQDVDGIYTLTVTMKDKAGHNVQTVTKFTVNRFGSVYEYSDYLVELINGKYVKTVDKDLVITEYNADKLVANSLKVDITRDGKSLSNVKLVKQTDKDADTSESGWYQYEYVISKDNFQKEGIYKISISSKDETGNLPENNNYKDKEILFNVDRTAPEITSIIGLENKIINAQTQEVKYIIFDTTGLASIKVYLNDEIIDEITEFEDINNYTGTFTIKESNDSQKIRIVAKDLAGNDIDTESDEFSSAYEFNSEVTVSTNFWVRWFANKPLFIGSILGFALVVSGIWFFIVLIKKRKSKSK